MYKRLLSLLILIPATSLAAKGGFDIKVVPVLAPNAYGSPSFDGWVTNALDAMRNDTLTAGTPGSPTYFEAASLGTHTVKENIVTGFNSWLGQTDLATGAYSAELGNRLHFAVHITGIASQFSAAQVEFESHSSDPGDALAWGWTGANYSSNWVGISYGPDGIKGTADDFEITSGPNTQLVNEIVSRGSGNAYAVYNDSSYPGATAQEKIDLFASGLESYSYTGTYRILGDGFSLGSGSGTADFQAVPEPASFGVLGLGLLGVIRRRFRK